MIQTEYTVWNSTLYFNIVKQDVGEQHKKIPQRRGRLGGRGGQGGRGGCGKTQGRSYNQNNRTPKFKGNSTDLEGYTFDCSDYKQAEKYVSTIKRIAEYVGA